MDDERTMTELSRLMIERTRKAVMSVGQLVEDDHLRGHMLVAVAIDVVRGAASIFEEGDMSKDEALAHAVAYLARGIGIKHIAAGVDAMVAMHTK